MNMIPLLYGLRLQIWRLRHSTFIAGQLALQTPEEINLSLPLLLQSLQLNSPYQMKIQSNPSQLTRYRDTIWLSLSSFTVGSNFPAVFLEPLAINLQKWSGDPECRD